MRCPHCGYALRPADRAVLTTSEALVLETIRDLRYSPLSPVSSRLISDTLGYSPTWVRRYLKRLLDQGVVCLPKGRCSGWVEVFVDGEAAQNRAA